MPSKDSFHARKEKENIIFTLDRERRAHSRERETRYKKNYSCDAKKELANTQNTKGPPLPSTPLLALVDSSHIPRQIAYLFHFSCVSIYVWSAPLDPSSPSLCSSLFTFLVSKNRNNKWHIAREKNRVFPPSSEQREIQARKVLEKRGITITMIGKGKETVKFEKQTTKFAPITPFHGETKEKKEKRLWSSNNQGVLYSPSVKLFGFCFEIANQLPAAAGISIEKEIERSNFIYLRGTRKLQTQVGHKKQRGEPRHNQLIPSHIHTHENIATIPVASDPSTERKETELVSTPTPVAQISRKKYFIFLLWLC